MTDSLEAERMFVFECRVERVQAPPPHEKFDKHNIVVPRGVNGMSSAQPSNLSIRMHAEGFQSVGPTPAFLEMTVHIYTI